MFTDWSMIDPHYFYLRGILTGVVLATLFWKGVVPILKIKRKQDPAQQGE